MLFGLIKVSEKEPEPDKFEADDLVWVRVNEIDDSPRAEMNPFRLNYVERVLPARVEQRTDEGTYLVRMVEQRDGKWVLTDLPVVVREADLAPRERKL